MENQIIEIIDEQIYGIIGFEILLEAYLAEKKTNNFFIDDLRKFSTGKDTFNLNRMKKILKRKKKFIDSTNLPQNFIQNMQQILDTANERLAKSGNLGLKQDIETFVKQHKYIKKIGRFSNGVGSYPRYKFDRSAQKKSISVPKKNNDFDGVCKAISSGNTPIQGVRDGRITLTKKIIRAKIRKSEKRRINRKKEDYCATAI